MCDKILETILNVYMIPQELLKVSNNNVSSMKIQNEQLKNKMNIKEEQ